MPARRQRLERLERQIVSISAEEKPPRVAGKTRLQAVLDWIEYLRRKSQRPELSEEEQERCEASIRSMESKLPMLYEEEERRKHTARTN